MSQIQIVNTPAGWEPEEVRKAFVGLTLMSTGEQSFQRLPGGRCGLFHEVEASMALGALEGNTNEGMKKARAWLANLKVPDTHRYYFSVDDCTVIDD